MSDQIKILTFSLDGDIYGVDISKILQVFRMNEVQKWKIANPALPSLKFFFRFQKEIYPLLDMRSKLNLELKEYSADNPIILLKSDEISVGFIVDSAFNVSNQSISELQSLHSFYYIDKSHFFNKAYIKDEKIICLLDERKILTSKEVNYLERVSEEVIKKVGASQ